MQVLILEDNSDIAANVGDYLEARGWTVDFALDGQRGLQLALNQSFDAIVLDIMLPKLDGLALCRRLRQGEQDRTPVLMLTARDTLEDKLAGFEAGADDYLVKPFALQELHARLNALVRRHQPGDGARLTVADLELDLGTLTARRAGQTLRLNPIGLKVLTLLMRASPKVVTREQIEREIWGDDPPYSGALRSHMYALRQAIDKPFAEALLHTIHGIGYRLAREEAGDAAGGGNP
ncbi:MAG: response regulator transcription factor [Candidatus Competibacterales bacterium]